MSSNAKVSFGAQKRENSSKKLYVRLSEANYFDIKYKVWIALFFYKVAGAPCLLKNNHYFNYRCIQYLQQLT
jgi:hypothetical protein